MSEKNDDFYDNDYGLSDNPKYEKKTDRREYSEESAGEYESELLTEPVTPMDYLFTGITSIMFTVVIILIAIFGIREIIHKNATYYDLTMDNYSEHVSLSVTGSTASGVWSYDNSGSIYKEMYIVVSATANTDIRNLNIKYTIYINGTKSYTGTYKEDSLKENKTYDHDLGKENMYIEYADMDEVFSIISHPQRYMSITVDSISGTYR